MITICEYCAKSVILSQKYPVYMSQMPLSGNPNIVALNIGEGEKHLFNMLLLFLVTLESLCSHSTSQSLAVVHMPG